VTLFDEVSVICKRVMVLIVGHAPVNPTTGGPGGFFVGLVAAAAAYKHGSLNKIENWHMIEIENITKVYQMGETEVRALNGISLKIEDGEWTAITGPSGSGKSTLMAILGCLDSPTSGAYHLDGVDVAKMSDDKLAAVRNKKIGFVFQTFNLLARTSALENVELPLLYSGFNHRRDKAKAAGSGGWLIGCGTIQ
jgi:predicted ABC-type transport system involved in lysophospholipase L1 biosynthesis ATPase subunit